MKWNRRDDDLRRRPGRRHAVEVLRQMSARSRRGVLDEIGKRDRALREQLEREMFTFEDLAQLDDDSFTALMNRVLSIDRDLLVVALRMSSVRMKQKVFRNLGPKTRDAIHYRLETMPKRRVSDVERAQRRIVGIAFELADEGLVYLGDEDDPLA